jgi:hypothetical protein
LLGGWQTGCVNPGGEARRYPLTGGQRAFLLAAAIFGAFGAAICAFVAVMSSRWAWELWPMAGALALGSAAQWYRYRRAGRPADRA